MTDPKELSQQPADTTESDARPSEPRVVGYGRPPQSKQFKKGQSGNPKGRPRGSKNLTTYIAQELKQKVTVTENGVRKTIPKVQAIAKRVVNGAASGENKMVPMLLGQDRMQSDGQSNNAIPEMQLSAEDDCVFELIIERIRKSTPPLNDDGPEQDAVTSEISTEPNNDSAEDPRL